MAECANCGNSVYVPDNYDFDEGDWCYECEGKMLAQARALAREAVEADRRAEEIILAGGTQVHELRAKRKAAVAKLLALLTGNENTKGKL